VETRNYESGASATPPSAPTTPSNGYPQEGVPGVTPPTVPGAHWYYKIGEALRAIVAGSGQTPSDADLNQLLKGLKRFAGGNVTTLTATATLTLDQAGLIEVDASAGNITLTLPGAADLASLGYVFARIDGSANTVTIAAEGGEAVGGAASIQLYNGAIRAVHSNGVNEFHLTYDSASQKMRTAVATAGYYTNIATLPFPVTDNVGANLTLLLTPKAAAGVYKPVLLTVTALQATAGLSATSKISMLSNDGQALAYNDVMLVTSDATNGTDVELWMQSIIAAAYDVQVLAESFDTGVSIIYNDGATWQVGAPSGAVTVTVTSDWVGYGAFVPAFTNGTFTYTTQTGYYIKSGGLITYSIAIKWTAKSGTGLMEVIIPNLFRSASSASFGYVASMYTGGSSYQLLAAADPGQPVRFFYINSGGSAATIDVGSLGATGEIKFNITGLVQ
jgi:hypothetical protein